MLYFSNFVGVIGLVIYIIGWIYQNKNWSHRAKKIGVFIMAVHIIFDCSLGIYDGFTGHAYRE